MASRRDDARPSQAIIVLGAAQYNGRPSPVLAARLDHAIDLYREHIAPVIVVTGGQRTRRSSTPKRARAPTTCTITVSPTPRSCARRPGRTSWESLEAAARFLKSRHMTRVVLVSDPYHSARIDAIAHEVGLEAVTSPTRTSPIKGVGGVEAHVRRDPARRRRDASSATHASTAIARSRSSFRDSLHSDPASVACGRLRPRRDRRRTHSGVV